MIGRRPEVTGSLARLVWLTLHLVYMTGVKSRITALLHWSVSFIGRGRAQRTATQEQLLGRRALHLLDGQQMTSILGSGVDDQREQPELDAEAVIGGSRATAGLEPR